MGSVITRKELTQKTVLLTIFVFCGVVLLFTLIAALLAPPSAQVGGTRPTDTIPAHLLELAGFGLLLGLGTVAIYGRIGFPIAFLLPVLVVLLDLDHLPAYLGIAQTIRPAHSLVFVVMVLAITAITIKRLEVDLMVLSATFVHMGIDTGLFAPLSPVNFDYYQLAPYRVPFLIGGVLAALGAGFVLRSQALRAEALRKESARSASS